MGHIDYFAEAAGIARAHEAARKAEDDYMAAWKKKWAAQSKNRPTEEKSLDEINAEELASFDAAEAAGINEVLRGRT